MRIRVLAAVVGFFVLASACSQGAGLPASLFQSKPEIAYGGTLVCALNSDVRTMSPLMAADPNSDCVIQQIHEALFRYEEDGRISGVLAESWLSEDDGRVWTVRLRKGVLWHDGNPLTSTDVKYTYDTLLNEAGRSPKRHDHSMIKDVRIVDDTTVRFVLREPYGSFLDRLTLGIVAKHHLEKVGIERYDQYPLGTGPFKFKERIPGERIVLEANTSYWQARPYLDRLVFRPILDASERLDALRNAEVDYVFGVGADELRVLEGLGKRFEVFKVPSLSFAYMALNNRNSLFRDVRVREALAHAIDKEMLVKEALSGMAVVSGGPVSMTNKEHHDSGVKKFVYSPERSRKLLLDAGFSPGPDRILCNWLDRKFEFTVLVRSDDPLWESISAMIQKWFLEIGVKMNIERLEWTEMNRRLDERDYEAALLGFYPGADPDQLNLWHSSAIDGGCNDWCYSNPDLDELLERGRRESDPVERRKMYSQMQQILAQDVAALWLYHPLDVSALSSDFAKTAAGPMGQSVYLPGVYKKDTK